MGYVITYSPRAGNAGGHQSTPGVDFNIIQRDQFLRGIVPILRESRVPSRGERLQLRVSASDSEVSEVRACHHHHGLWVGEDR